MSGERVALVQLLVFGALAAAIEKRSRRRTHEEVQRQKEEMGER
jgi:hypothetical protein